MFGLINFPCSCYHDLISLFTIVNNDKSYLSTVFDATVNTLYADFGNFSILEILACYGWLKETPSIFQVFGTNIN